MTPYEAYGKAAKMSMSDREAEASALSRAAQLLEQCRDNWQAPDADARLAEALAMNQQLWTIFQAELSQPEHPLPASLRRDTLSLSVFVDKRIFEIMAYPSPEKLTAIININRNLAAGLRSGASKQPEAGETCREQAIEPAACIWG